MSFSRCGAEIILDLDAVLIPEMGPKNRITEIDSNTYVVRSEERVVPARS